MAKVRKRTRVVRPLGTSSNSEVVEARSSATYGDFASLDARLEAFEILVATASHSAPTLSGNLANVLDINASTVFSFDSQNQNLALLSPNGSSGEPSFRAIAAADLPNDVVYDSVTITAGAGLAGGGDLSSSRTINVGAGTGVTVNADDIEIDFSEVAAQSDLHPAVTMGSDTAPVFSIGAGQILNFDSQSQNLFLASPDGSAGDPSFRAIVFDDVPSSSDPGAAESILATDSSGLLSLEAFKIQSGSTDVMVFDNTNDTATAPDIQFSGNAMLAAEASFFVAIDSNDDGTNGAFNIYKNAPDTGGTRIFQMSEASNMIVGDDTGSVSIFLDGAAGSTRDVSFRSANVLRWVLRTSSTAEGGSDAGSNFQILARDDSGSAVVTALEITRATGYATFGQYVETTGLGIGATAANDDSIRFNDGTADILLTAVDPTYPDDGLAIRTLTNPSSGEPIFRVMSGGGNERLRVEHDGVTSSTNPFESDTFQTTGGEMLMDTGGIDLESSGDQGVRILGTNTDVSGGIMFLDFNETDRDGGSTGAVELGFYRDANNTTQIRMSKEIFEIAIHDGGTWTIPFEVRGTQILMAELPTSDPSITGALWRTTGATPTLRVSV